MRVRLDKHYWLLTSRLTQKIKEEDLDGLADPDGTQGRGRAVFISPAIEDKRLLLTVNHELLHCMFPWLDEDAVITAAYDLTQVLWKLGARIEPPPKD